MKYKALVYLTQPVHSNGITGIACLHTPTDTNKQAVLNYIKTLYDQKLIQAYRLIYSPNDDDSWYNDSEVAYLPNDHQPIFSSM